MSKKKNVLKPLDNPSKNKTEFVRIFTKKIRAWQKEQVNPSSYENAVLKYIEMATRVKKTALAKCVPSCAAEELFYYYTSGNFPHKPNWFIL